MAERIPPSAAQALYGRLKSVAREMVQPRHQPGSIADAMYPRPKPPLRNPYLEPMSEVEIRDQFWALAGLRRKR